MGTAMGNKFAPPYAILFLADLEERVLASANLKPTLFVRFIDFL